MYIIIARTNKKKMQASATASKSAYVHAAEGGDGLCPAAVRPAIGAPLRAVRFHLMLALLNPRRLPSTGLDFLLEPHLLQPLFVRLDLQQPVETAVVDAHSSEQ